MFFRSTKGADYAEYLPKANPNEIFYPGDIVGIKGGYVTKKTDDADLIMVVSSRPIVLGNLPAKGDPPSIQSRPTLQPRAPPPLNPPHPPNALSVAMCGASGVSVFPLPDWSAPDHANDQYPHGVSVRTGSDTEVRTRSGRCGPVS